MGLYHQGRQDDEVGHGSRRQGNAEPRTQIWCAGTGQEEGAGQDPDSSRGVRQRMHYKYCWAVRVRGLEEVSRNSYLHVVHQPCTDDKRYKHYI